MQTSSTARVEGAHLAGLAQQRLLRTIEQMVQRGLLDAEQAALLQRQYAPGSTR